jgi:putative ABC transport system substrate-binding protein
VAKKATSAIPIVMAMTGQPVAMGLVASLSRPGGNVTGLSGDVGPEIVGKRLELLKEAVPHLRRIGALRDPAFPWSEANRQAEDDAARKLGVSFERIDVPSAEDFERAFAAVDARRIDGLTFNSAALFFGNRTRTIALVANSRRPAIYSSREFVEAGGLLSYGVNFADLCRRAATYVDKILKGAKPADLPVGAADKIRARHQPQDRQRPRPQHPALAPATGGSGN